MNEGLVRSEIRLRAPVVVVRDAKTERVGPDANA